MVVDYFIDVSKMSNIPAGFQPNLLRKEMKKTIKFTLAASAVVILAACGGGGSSSPVASADPQGFWSGLASTGYTVNAVVLENGETWGVFSSGSTIYGANYGAASTNGNNISIVGTEFNFLTNRSVSGTLTGPFVAKSTMTLTGSGVSVPLAYQATYDTPATSAAITGTWSFIGRSGLYTLVPGRVTIDSAGSFTLVQTGCTTTGSVTPRPGGKNVYNVTLLGSGVNCVAGQSTMSGVLYIDRSVTPNKFISLALTPSKTDGVVVIGTKQ